MNILWLMTDQHNPFVGGWAGDPYVKTPFLDSLAATGTVFNAAYTPDPICVPARQAFHSGRMASNLDLVNINYEAMGTFFSRKGLQTAWYGKQHWETMVNAWQDVGYDSGKMAKKLLKQAGLVEPPESRLVKDAYVYPFGTEYNPDTLTADQAVDFLQAYDGQKPFFLGVSMVKPHFPYTIQQQYVDMYLNAGIPNPVVTEAALDDLSAALKSDRIRFGVDQLTPEQTAFARAIYYGSLTYLDQQFARVCNELSNRGLANDTIIIYTSDHGDLIGQHGMWYKNAFFEGSARVPLIVKVPGPLSVATCNAPVSTLDLYPTLCDLLGLTPPSTLEGHSLVPLMTGADNGSDRVVFSENKRIGIAARMIRTNEYKYCWYEDGFEQLYEMSWDRDAESTNIAKLQAYNSICKTLKAAALLNWNKKGLNDSDD